MICLGIESTAHTFGVGISDEKSRKKILSNVKAVYKPPLGFGIHPKEAAEHHKKNAVDVIKQSLSAAGLEMKDIDIIAVSQGPGLPPCLNVGMTVAKTLSMKYKKPLYGVNHCIAHIEIGRMTTGTRDPIFVYVSGGNTQIIGYAAGRYRVFGETEDIAIGNARDLLARRLGLGNPGGPIIDEIAKKGKKYIELPYTVKGMDLSFTGIVTATLKKYSSGIRLEDLLYSFQETTFAMLVEVTERALAHTGKNELLLAGGVAASPRLQDMMKIMCKERGAKFKCVKKEYAGDCGANIAWTGILARKNKIKPLKMNEKIKQNWRTDEVRWTLKL
ncbi:MAG: bifunctional N(6)-L-threonylcarbamoyladenine synthase/serine/threonine protein kinase [Candidatus Aenigmatarchaeota archaeon]|nr:MAG: bifunctional N(6)-L-threonylcarbamoyladenine synthase/serine/threonine protein kinase [Candidatus Aenigmarchaeota archaeon]